MSTLPLQSYKSPTKPIWCPGCGDYAVLNALMRTFADLELPPEEIVVASGIGCSSRFPAFLKTYGFHGVHGRPLPLATGIKLANPSRRSRSTGPPRAGRIRILRRSWTSSSSGNRCFIRSRGTMKPRSLYLSARDGCPLISEVPPVHPTPSSSAAPSRTSACYRARAVTVRPTSASVRI